MKKIILVLLIIMLLSSLSLAANAHANENARMRGQDDDSEDDTETDDEEEEEEENEVSNEDATITLDRAKEIAIETTGGEVEETDMEMEDGRKVYEIEIKKDGKEADVLVDMETGEVIEVEWEGTARERVRQNQKARTNLQKQNEVREAVKALLAIEDREGGIGQQVREIARDFDNSVQATITAEEKIERRSKIKRLFAGGDEEAALEIESRLKIRREKIEQLKTLREGANEEDGAILEEKIQTMEEEQTRLGQLAIKEKSSK